MTIHELNEQRAQLSLAVTALRMMNACGLSSEERLKADAQYRLAHDAWMKAEADYRHAINAMNAREIAALSRGHKE